ncbi:MAG TPA: hypothetical protein VF490_12810, partial [Chryseosolibacter sp.]
FSISSLTLLFLNSSEKHRFVRILNFGLFFCIRLTIFGQPISGMHTVTTGYRLPATDYRLLRVRNLTKIRGHLTWPENYPPSGVKAGHFRLSIWYSAITAAAPAKKSPWHRRSPAVTAACLPKKRGKTAISHINE